MFLALKEKTRSENRSSSKYAQRLKKLNDDAAEVRRLYEQGKISSEEASARLREMKLRHRTLLDIFL